LVVETGEKRRYRVIEMLARHEADVGLISNEIRSATL